MNFDFEIEYTRLVTLIKATLATAASGGPDHSAERRAIRDLRVAAAELGLIENPEFAVQALDLKKKGLETSLREVERDLRAAKNAADQFKAVL